ncbi:AIG2-like protein [Coccomyxa subellipsoidea C-169]|uniref:Putative gamma-glutamylcyclotransferase n=1 Tax=Coccomyxa subellipsoidea (strain C-169) TaxID=574566 RepID=I0Z7Y1_COCSC|nr:AIG2-like protein [Coccomyxa subellipsoidea C-169]EIE26750.1 AIG2-like protein [Coccomyxa subellipsoidea C-169]|eukprot:XP_005651294.1 AIG2-like protein [Coccomyxa subellipsoidea C-169]
MSNVFVYGTLMSEEVVAALIRRAPRQQPAKIRGYRRHRIKGFIFPAIVPAEESDEVNGLVLYGLNCEEMEVFDEFEGEEYYKTDATPILADGSQVDASVYVWQDSARHLLYGKWDYQEWRRKHLENYVKMCTIFKEELELTNTSNNRPYNHPEPVEST